MWVCISGHMGTTEGETHGDSPTMMMRGRRRWRPAGLPLAVLMSSAVDVVREMKKGGAKCVRRGPRQVALGDRLVAERFVRPSRVSASQ